MMDKIIKIIEDKKLGKILKEESLKNYNTYKIDIKAKCIYFPNSIKSLTKVIKYLKEKELRFMILGKGSNIILALDYFDGMIIKLENLNELTIKENIIEVGAGYSLTTLSLKTAKKGLSGLEFASGIPGTIGGAIYMNAGAYKSDMSEVVTKIKVLTPNFKIKTLYKKDLDLNYRHSILKENKDYICLSATLKLRNRNKDEIMELIKTRAEKRKETQPLEYPSAGSVFRNPEGNFAGKLIEDLNLKGKNINGAEVSTKHANFIINKEKCNGKDIVELITIIKDKVKKEYDIDLKLEQEIIN